MMRRFILPAIAVGFTMLPLASPALANVVSAQTLAAADLKAASGATHVDWRYGYRYGYWHRPYWRRYGYWHRPYYWRRYGWRRPYWRG